MKQSRWTRCAQAGLVGVVACILPLGCASSTSVFATTPEQNTRPTVPASLEVDIVAGEHLDGSPPSSDLGRQDRAASIGRDVTPASSSVFTLDVELGREPGFRLFPGGDLGPTEMIPHSAELSCPKPTVSLLASLTYVTDQDRVPEGLQITFEPLTWDDLDGWEKTGLVVSYASSVVGAAYLLYYLFN